MLEAVDTFGDFKVYPTVAAVLFKVVIVDEFLWDLVDMNADIFWAIERRFEVEVGDICCEKFCILSGADAVEDPFDKFEETCLRAHIAEVCNSVASDGDGVLMGYSLVGLTSQTTCECATSDV